MFDRRIEWAVDTTSSFNMADAAIERYVYDGDNVVLDFLDPDGDGTGTAQALKTRYVHGPNVDQILAQEDAGTNAVLWHLGDHLGTVRDVIESDGDLVAHIAYDSFGRITSVKDSGGDPTTSPTRYLFTGREFDSATGLQYNRARWYDANAGQWASEDPIGFSAGDANVRRYVGNDSVALMDPRGLWPHDKIDTDFSTKYPRPEPSSAAGGGLSATDAIDIGADFTPGVSTVKSGVEALTGVNPVTGDELSAGQRCLSAIGIIPFGRIFGRICGRIFKTGGKVAGEAAEAAKVAEKVAEGAAKDAGKIAEAVEDAGKHLPKPKPHPTAPLPNPGDLKVPKTGQLGGIDVEQFKIDIVGKNGAGTFNVAVDKNGTVILVPVKKGSSAPIYTGHTMDDLRDIWPKKRAGR